MRIATWNVNSIKARFERLAAWLKKVKPDLLCLQEIKTLEENFPMQPLLASGYLPHVYGQKTYSGVALLSRQPMTSVVKGWGKHPWDHEARLLVGALSDVTVLCVYVPNGQEVGTEKWKYKIHWLEQFLRHLKNNYQPNQKLLIAGDFNIAPHDHDVAQPELWQQSVLCHAEVRQFYQNFIQWGLVDLGEKFFPQGGQYSWWDYRQLAFAKNHGLRLDLLLDTLCDPATAFSFCRQPGLFSGCQPLCGLAMSNSCPVINKRMF